MIDPQIALGVQPAQIQSPMDAYAKALSLKNMMQQGQLQDLQVQQERQGLADDQNFRQLYNQSLQTGQPIPDDQIMRTLGPARGAAFLNARLTAQKTNADVQQLKDQHAAATKDYMGSLAYGVQQAGYTPEAIRAAIAQANADGYSQQAQGLNQLLTTNPGAIKGMVDTAVQQSPKVQEMISARTSANARQTGADATKRRTDAELPGLQAKSADAVRESAAAALGAAKDKDSYARAWYALDPTTAKQFPHPDTFDPKTTPATVQAIGSTPAQQATAAQAAANATETARHNRADESQGAQRNAIEQNRFNQQYGDPVANATPQEIAAAKMRAAGTLPLPSPRSPGYDKAVALAQHFDTSGTFDQYAGTRFNTIRDFKNSGDANNLVAITTALGHLERAQQNSAALGTEPSMALNWTPTQRRYHQDVYNLTDEIGRLIKAGVLPEAEGKRAIGNLMSFSQSNRDAGLDELSKLMGGKFEGIVQKYRNGTGMALPASMFDAPTLDRLKRQGLANGLDMGGAAPQPQPGAPAPAAGAPAPAARKSLNDIFGK